jgi:hypothetical protein
VKHFLQHRPTLGACTVAAVSLALILTFWLASSGTTTPFADAWSGQSARSVKRGVSNELSSSANEVDIEAQMQALGASWVYHWGPSPSAGYTSTEFTKIPMVRLEWRLPVSQTARQAITETQAYHCTDCTWLVFNEPNNYGQDGSYSLSPTDFANLFYTTTTNMIQTMNPWTGHVDEPRFIVGGLEMSDNFLAQDVINWLSEFQDRYVAQHGSLPTQTVGIHIHNYIVVDSQQHAAKWESELVKVKDWVLNHWMSDGHQQIWLTEFGVNSGSTNALELMDEVEWLDNQGWIQRYAWFSTYSGLWGGTSLTTSQTGNTLTSLGQTYSQASLSTATPTATATPTPTPNSDHDLLSTYQVSATVDDAWNSATANYTQTSYLVVGYQSAARVTGLRFLHVALYPQKEVFDARLLLFVSDTVGSDWHVNISVESNPNCRGFKPPNPWPGRRTPIAQNGSPVYIAWDIPAGSFGWKESPDISSLLTALAADAMMGGLSSVCVILTDNGESANNYQSAWAYDNGDQTKSPKLVIRNRIWLCDPYCGDPTPTPTQTPDPATHVNLSVTKLTDWDAWIPYPDPQNYRFDIQANGTPIDAVELIWSSAGGAQNLANLVVANSLGTPITSATAVVAQFDSVDTNTITDTDGEYSSHDSSGWQDGLVRLFKFYSAPKPTADHPYHVDLRGAELFPTLSGMDTSLFHIFYNGSEIVDRSVTALASNARMYYDVMINSGGISTTLNHNRWLADREFHSSNPEFGGYLSDQNLYSISVGPREIYNTSEDNLYVDAVATTSSRLYYKYWVDADVPVTVTVRFAELQKTAASQRVFSVNCNALTYVSNLDVYAASGGQNIAYDRTFNCTADSNGYVLIEFVQQTGDPFVSAIRVVDAAAH